MENKIGFIILRNVNSKEDNILWKHSYDSVRKHYPENCILIIDDNSNYNYIDTEYENKLYNTKIIKSEYNGRAELLPYYYYLHNKLFDTAVIIHDSVFINSKLDLSVDNYKFFWDFKHDWDNPNKEINIIKNLNNNEELLELHSKKDLWKGCFGVMCIIKYDYLKEIDDKYSIKNLLNCINTKPLREGLERVISCILQKNNNDIKNDTLLGDIHDYCRWNIKYSEINEVKHLPVIKIWCGRSN